MTDRDREWIDLDRNDDGTWTACFYRVRFTGSLEACIAWIEAYQRLWSY